MFLYWSPLYWTLKKKLTVQLKNIPICLLKSGGKFVRALGIFSTISHVFIYHKSFNFYFDFSFILKPTVQTFYKLLSYFSFKPNKNLIND